jgi:hypothetical protein
MNDLDYQRTVAFNNHAVALLKAGDLQTSLNLFRGALQSTIGLLDGSSECPFATPQEIQAFPSRGGVIGSSLSCVSSVQRGQQQPIQAHLQAQDQPIHSDPFQETEGDVTNQFAFIRALNLIPLSNVYSEDPLVNLSIVSSIVLFNLSIVYHHQGLTKEMECQSRLAQENLYKAQSLYAKAQALLMESGISTTESRGHAVIDVVNMAIYNNLAQSYHIQANYAVSKHYFGLLVRYASSVIPELHDPDTANLLEWHKSFFLLNAFALQPPAAASAA